MDRKLLVAIVLMWMCSCGSNREAPPLALYPASPEGHGASVRGTLQRDGPCLYIMGEGGERWLAAFPSPGTTWDAGTSSVRVGAQSIRIGASADFEGGETKSGIASLRWTEAPDRSCDGGKIWLVTGAR